MMTTMTRRKFAMTGLLGGAAAIILPKGRFMGMAPESGEGFCVTLCNHWSYIGIGWQLGIESNVLSVTDAMEMADRKPHVKDIVAFCLSLDPRQCRISVTWADPVKFSSGFNKPIRK